LGTIVNLYELGFQKLVFGTLIENQRNILNPVPFQINAIETPRLSEKEGALLVRK
jgi:hypothetical protein